ncbi:putative pyrroloquinoline-quinone binding quinoprotein [Streptomyces sp. 846.5]|nr:PQQ-binding-like beta-propeller repeat protein [Streptomyces sp. 846.5]TDT97635.1 putative pyrroloquinoline-quinone binding quinoprotein [Streptomyces sp. 846.5]
MSEAIVAIDFGTSTSSAAVVAGGGDFKLIMERGTHSWSWPSSVYLQGETLLVGTPAERLKRLFPGNYRTEFKRDFAQRAPVHLGGRPFSPTALVTRVLEALRSEAGNAATRAVLTVPSDYAGPHDPRWQEMITAGRAAGFEVVELIYEPVAAALEPPADGPFAPGDLVLVYDFGGGTFDAALVRINDGSQGMGPTLLGHRSRPDIGGMDIDRDIFTWIKEHGHADLADLVDDAATAADQEQQQEQRLAAQRARIELGSLCVQLKIQLTEHPVAMELFKDRYELALDRPTFDKRAQPLIAETIACCLELLDAAGVSPDQLAGVLLVGGSSQMPLVTEALRRAFPDQDRVRICTTAEPEYAVVRGAARFAGLARRRFASQSGHRPHERAVRWTLPEGYGELLRHRVGVGETYRAGIDLAEVRLASGAVIGLRSVEPGTVKAWHVGPGAEVHSGDWLLTAQTLFRPWRSGVPQPVGSPALSDGSLFVSSGSGRVEARVTATGDLHWAAEVGGTLSTGPVVRDGTVYVGDAEGRCHALDAETGAPRWSAPYRAEGAVSCPPAVSGQLVCFGSADRRVHILDTATGSAVHRIDAGDAVLSLALSGRLLQVVSAQGRLTVRDVQDSRLLWSAPLPLHGLPVSADDTVLACYPDGEMVRLRMADGEELWRARYGPAPGQIEAMRRNWIRGGAYRATAAAPILACDGAEVPAERRLVYLAAPDGFLTARTLADREGRWQVRLPAAALSMSARDGVLYVATAGPDHEVRAFTSDGQPTGARYRTFGPVGAAPVAADGAVAFLSGDGTLHALAATTLRGPAPVGPVPPVSRAAQVLPDENGGARRG